MRAVRYERCESVIVFRDDFDMQVVVGKRRGTGDVEFTDVIRGCKQASSVLIERSNRLERIPSRYHNLCLSDWFARGVDNRAADIHCCAADRARDYDKLANDPLERCHGRIQPFLIRETETILNGVSSVSVRNVILICLVFCLPAIADDWPRWRGPNLNGISNEVNWNHDWKKHSPKAAWKVNVGTGFSSVTVAGGRAYTIGNSDEHDTVYCLDTESGRVVWQHRYPCPLEAKFFPGGPTSTPTIDGDSVYAISRHGDVFRLNAATGKVIWSRDLDDEVDARIPGWGFAGSPLVHENLVVLNVGDSGMVLDKRTGTTVWSSMNKDAGYSTPLPYQHRGEWYAILGSAKSYVAVRIRDGEELWRHRWLTRYGVNAADPILADGHAFISTGYGKGATLLNIAQGEPVQVWKQKTIRSQMNAGIKIGDHVYGFDGDTGTRVTLRCIDFNTGDVKWQVEDVGSGGLTAAGDKLIVLTESGKLMVGVASPERFQPIGEYQAIDGKCWSVPVLANGRIYCRNADGDVVCVEVRRATD